MEEWEPIEVNNTMETYIASEAGQEFEVRLVANFYKLRAYDDTSTGEQIAVNRGAACAGVSNITCCLCGTDIEWIGHHLSCRIYCDSIRMSTLLLRAGHTSGVRKGNLFVAQIMSAILQ